MAPRASTTGELHPPLGLPARIRACLFDLDGVLTRTASVHAKAWKRLFDDLLRERSAHAGERLAPFDPVRDYDLYVDGKRRDDGTRSFLAARGISLPEGSPDDPPGAPTIRGLGERKNELFLELLRTEGVHVFPGSLRYLRAVRAAGLRSAVVTSSRNGEEVLRAAGIADLLDARVDGNVAAAERLRGKPAPDTYLAAARAVGVAPAEAAVFEDALAGVEAGRAGGFGVVVGVDRAGQADALRRRGADRVVEDLAALVAPP
jgi:beta-phosphoglucomutase family hydrolase